MEVGKLQQSLMDHMNSLRSQEILDSQFGQLQRLQDESSPNVVAEVLTLFFTDSKDLIEELSEALNQQNVDFKEVDSCVHQLKGSSARLRSKLWQRAVQSQSWICKSSIN